MEMLNDSTLKGQIILADFRRRLTLSIMRVSEGLEELKNLRRDVINVTRQPLGEIELGPDLPIEDLEFSVRVYNCLKKENINTLGQLLDNHAENDLLGIRNLGPTALAEIKDRLRELGLELAK